MATEIDREIGNYYAFNVQCTQPEERSEMGEFNAVPVPS